MAKKQSPYVKRAINKAVKAALAEAEAKQPRRLNGFERMCATYVGEDRVRELNAEQINLLTIDAHRAEADNADVLAVAERFVQAWIAHPRDENTIGQAHAELIRTALNRRVSQDRVKKLARAMSDRLLQVTPTPDGYKVSNPISDAAAAYMKDVREHGYIADKVFPAVPADTPVAFKFSGSDVARAARSVVEQTGMQPNTIVMGRKVFKALGGDLRKVKGRKRARRGPLKASAAKIHEAINPRDVFGKRAKRKGVKR